MINKHLLKGKTRCIFYNLAILLCILIMQSCSSLPANNGPSGSSPPADNGLDGQNGMLFKAAKAGDLEGVENAIDNGANVNVEDAFQETAIMYAAYENHGVIVDYLLTKNIMKKTRDELMNYRELGVSIDYDNPHIRDFLFVWKAVKDVYPYLDYKHIDWDSMYGKYYRRAANLGGKRFERVLREMLAELRDAHVGYKTEEKDGEIGRHQPYVPPRKQKDQGLFSLALVGNHFDKPLEKVAGGSLSYGITPADIGYMHIEYFGKRNVRDHGPAIGAFMEKTKGLILDVRRNQGGNYPDMAALVSVFLTAPMEVNEEYHLGKRINYRPIAPYGKMHYSRPVVVLINGVTVSSGEWFVEIMKQIDTVTVVGGATLGGSGGYCGDTGRYTLPNSKIDFWISTSDVRKYSGDPWEEVGITPDIPIEQTLADVEQGIDRQLEYALKLLTQ